jgi:hypothetical protein
MRYDTLAYLHLNIASKAAFENIHQLQDIKVLSKRYKRIGNLVHKDMISEVSQLRRNIINAGPFRVIIGCRLSGRPLWCGTRPLGWLLCGLPLDKGRQVCRSLARRLKLRVLIGCRLADNLA